MASLRKFQGQSDAGGVTCRSRALTTRSRPIHVHADEAGGCLSVRRHGQGLLMSAAMVIVQYVDDVFLHRGRAGGNRPLRRAGNLQHRPRQPVHQL